VGAYEGLGWGCPWGLGKRGGNLLQTEVVDPCVKNGWIHTGPNQAKPVIPQCGGAITKRHSEKKNPKGTTPLRTWGPGQETGDVGDRKHEFQHHGGKAKK